MLGKGGQAEDFLSDLIPAVMVIVLALGLGTFFSATHSRDLEAEVNVAAVEFNGMDAFAFLRMPVDVEGYADMAHLLTSVSDAYEGRDMKSFESAKIARMGSEYAECSEVFMREVDRFFGGKRWVVYISEVQDRDVFPQKKIFSCENIGVEPFEGFFFSEAFLPSSGFTAYAVLVGWKNE